MEISKLRRVANWIDFAISLLAVAFIVTVLIKLAELDLSGEAFKTLRSQRFTIIAAGATIAAALLLGAIIRAVQHASAGGDRRYLVFETPNGTVSVRATSVEHVLNRAAASLEEVADASVALVLPKGEKLPREATVRCRLFDRPNILAIQDKVRAAIGDCYLEMFPGQEPLTIQISVERILFELPEPKPAPPPSTEEETEDREPFRPQYPVND